MWFLLWNKSYAPSKFPTTFAENCVVVVLKEALCPSLTIYFETISAVVIWGGLSDKFA